MSKERAGRSIREFIRNPVKVVKENPIRTMGFAIGGLGAMAIKLGIDLVGDGDYRRGDSLIYVGVMAIVLSIFLAYDIYGIDDYFRSQKPKK